MIHFGSAKSGERQALPQTNPNNIGFVQTRLPLPITSPLERGRGEGVNRRAYPPEYLTANARHLRRAQTDAEALLCRRVKNRHLGGPRFRRQFPIGSYIADFCCFENRLVIEIDGGQHDMRSAADEARTSLLESHGYRVVRFWNNEVLTNLEGVAGRILEELARGPSPRPSPLSRPGDRARHASPEASRGRAARGTGHSSPEGRGG